MKETCSEPGRLAPGAPAHSDAAPPTQPTPRRRARFSLVTLVWLLTVTALAVGLWQTGREVRPLREEVARVREELGYFPIEDESRIQIRRLRGKIPNAWQWRLYLPRNQVYNLYVFHGPAPEARSLSRAKWCELLRAQPSTKAKPIESGESSFEALLTRYGGQWWLVYGPVGQRGQLVCLAPRDKWLNEETSWSVASDVSYENVAILNAQEPVVLLHIEKGVHGDGDDNVWEDAPVDDQIVIWIGP